MVKIRDMIFVKQIERRLNRPLREEEMDGESHSIRFPGGRYEFVQVPLLIFPYDLLSEPIENYSAFLMQPPDHDEETNYEESEAA